MRRIAFTCICAALMIALYAAPGFAEETTAVAALDTGGAAVSADGTGAPSSAGAPSSDYADSAGTHAAAASEDQAPLEDSGDATTPSNVGDTAPANAPDGCTPQEAPVNTPDANIAADDATAEAATTPTADSGEAVAVEAPATETGQPSDAVPAAGSDIETATPSDDAAVAAAASASAAKAAEAEPAAKSASGASSKAPAATSKAPKNTVAPAKTTASDTKATVKKPASKVSDKHAYLVHNTVYCISTALAKKNVYTLGVRSTPGKGKYNVVLLGAAKEL